jgi:hypothetical protein
MKALPLLLSAVPGIGVTRPIRRDFNPVGRNARCPCGSGKKFKACHLPRHMPGHVPDEIEDETEADEVEIKTSTGAQPAD